MSEGPPLVLWVSGHITYDDLGVGSERGVVGAQTTGTGLDATIQINSNGFFIRPSHTNVTTSTGTKEISITNSWAERYGLLGLTDKDVQGIALLHELAHALLGPDKFPSDGGLPEESQRNTGRIIDNCIK